MLIPYNTDAPIYYFPYATIGLIVANVVVYFATAAIAANDNSIVVIDAAEFVQVVDNEGNRVFSDDDIAKMQAVAERPSAGSIFSLAQSPRVLWLTLQFDRINPIQWLTHNFMHADILHLAGNMIFLWGFGLVVEGKLGWLKFTGLYAVICLLQGALIQTIMYFAANDYGLALGASGAIYGIMAIAVLWAPKNEMSCIIFFRIIPRMIEMPIVAFGGIYLAFQLLFFFLHGFSMSSEALHLSGILVAAPLGLLFLSRNWVDCEGWDFHTVYFAKSEKRDAVRSEFRDRNRLAEAKEAREERNHAREQILSSLQGALGADQPGAALAIYKKFESDFQQGKKLPTEMLPKLVSAMHKQKQWEASIPLLVELLQRHPSEKAVGVRLKLAQILIQATDQPKQGIAVLKKLPTKLTEKQLQTCNKLAKLAKAALAEGSFEVEVKDW